MGTPATLRTHGSGQIQPRGAQIPNGMSRRAALVEHDAGPKTELVLSVTRVFLVEFRLGTGWCKNSGEDVSTP